MQPESQNTAPHAFSPVASDGADEGNRAESCQSFKEFCELFLAHVPVSGPVCALESEEYTDLTGDVQFRPSLADWPDGWAAALLAIDFPGSEEDPMDAIQELRRVLRPGGVLLFATANPPRRSFRTPFSKPIQNLLASRGPTEVYTAGNPECPRVTVTVAYGQSDAADRPPWQCAAEVWRRAWTGNRHRGRRIFTPGLKRDGEHFRLDLGCGPYCRPGFVGVDAQYSPGVDILCDMNLGIPFPDNSVSHVFTSHFLEHVDDLDFVLREIHRVSIGGARIEILVPLHEETAHLVDSYNDHHTVFHEEWFNENLDKEQFEIVSQQVEEKSGMNVHGKVHSWSQILVHMRTRKSQQADSSLECSSRAA